MTDLNSGKIEQKTKIKACSITFSDAEDILVKKAFVSEVTSKGFKLILNYRDLVSESLKLELDLHSLYHKNIHAYIPDMEMDWAGKVTGSRHLGKGNFEVNIEFFQQEPKYWRECLFDLWPKSFARL